MNIATEFNEFKDTLFNKKVLRHKMRRIQGKKHKMGTYEINKISLSCFDDKRFVLNNGIHTLAYFHKDLNKYILTNNFETISSLFICARNFLRVYKLQIVTCFCFREIFS